MVQESGDEYEYVRLKKTKLGILRMFFTEVQ